MTQTIEKNLFMLGNKQAYYGLERDLVRLEQASRTQTNPFVEQVGGIYQEWEGLRETVQQLLATEFCSSPAYFEQYSNSIDQLNPLAADHCAMDALILQIEGYLEAAQHSKNNRQAAYKNYLNALGQFRAVTLAHIGR